MAMRVVIVGGGIGGLAAAVALRRAGVEASVIEKVGVMREVGAGLALWSNAVNALRELGIEAAVLACASVVERSHSRTPKGRAIATTDFVPLSRQAGAPCICLPRAALHRILLECLPSDVVRTGLRCIGFKDSRALLDNGDRIEFDVLIGADGISSVIRGGLHGTASPRYAGFTCWRGMCSATGQLPDRSTLLAMGAGSQFGLWPCGDGRLYWFLTKNAPRGTTQTKADALAACRNWATPVPSVIEATPADAIVQNDIVDRLPLQSWGRGNVTLLGDAAHAPTPNLGQGACMALEDAVVLAHCLTRVSPVPTALRDYERLRIPRTSRVVRDSWRSGKIMQLDNAVLEPVRNRFLSSRLAAFASARLFRNLLMYRVPTL